MLELRIKSADGTLTTLAVSSRDLTKAKLLFADELFLGMDKYAIGQTGWQTFSLDIPVSPGKGEIRIALISEGPGNDLHSVLLVDNIRFAR